MTCVFRHEADMTRRPLESPLSGAKRNANVAPDFDDFSGKADFLDQAQAWYDPDLPAKPASSLRGLVCHSLQAFSRGFNLRLSRPVTARPRFCR